MKHTKTLFLLGFILTILPFTGLPLTWKNWVGVAIGVIIIILALIEQISQTVKDRGSSFKRISVERHEEENINNT